MQHVGISPLLFVLAICLQAIGLEVAQIVRLHDSQQWRRAEWWIENVPTGDNNRGTLQKTGEAIFTLGRIGTRSERGAEAHVEIKVRNNTLITGSPHLFSTA